MTLGMESVCEGRRNMWILNLSMWQDKIRNVPRAHKLSTIGSNFGRVSHCEWVTLMYSQRCETSCSIRLYGSDITQSQTGRRHWGGRGENGFNLIKIIGFNVIKVTPTMLVWVEENKHENIVSEQLFFTLTLRHSPNISYLTYMDFSIYQLCTLFGQFPQGRVSNIMNPNCYLPWFHLVILSCAPEKTNHSKAFLHSLKAAKLQIPLLWLLPGVPEMPSLRFSSARSLWCVQQPVKGTRNNACLYSLAGWDRQGACTTLGGESLRCSTRGGHQERHTVFWS